MHKFSFSKTPQNLMQCLSGKKPSFGNPGVGEWDGAKLFPQKSAKEHKNRRFAVCSKP